MKNASFIFICIVAFAASLKAQPDIQSILRAVKSDERMSMAASFRIASKKHEFRLPYVESVDFRTDWDRMMSTRQRFRVRANFNGFLQNNAEIKRYNSLVSIKSLKLLKEQKDFLSGYYMQILDAIDADKTYALSVELLQHYLTIDNVYRNALAIGKQVDVVDYLKNKENILSLQSRKILLNHKRVLRYRGLKLDTNSIIETRDLITPQQMKAHIAVLKTNPLKNLENKQLNAELELLNAKANLKKAENSKLIDYVQVGYSVREDLIAENKFTVALGFTLPYKGSTRVALKELALNKSELLAETEISSLNLKDEYERLLEEFELNFANLSVIKELFQSPDYLRLKENIQHSGYVSVIDSEAVNKSEIEARILQWEYYRELIKCYIKIVTLNDVIIDLPLRNYLVGGFPEL